MDEMDLRRVETRLSGFDSVWRRVNGSAPAENNTVTPENTLSDLLRNERILYRLYCRLHLNAFAACSMRRIRRLCAEYFICTGNIPEHRKPPESEQAHRATLLRRSMLLASSLAKQYDAADIPELSPLFAVFAAQNRRDAVRLRTLILKQFIT